MTMINLPNTRVPCTHKKTGNHYLYLGVVLDCTNSRDGEHMVMYVHADKPQEIPYVREATEFWEKFELNSN